MVGKRISARDMKARWSWSELTSPRFSKKIVQHGVDAERLQKLAEDGGRFADLTEVDKWIIATIADERQSGFLQSVAGVNEFVCEEWTKNDLRSTIVICALSPEKDRNIPYSEFIENQPYMVDGKPE